MPLSPPRQCRKCAQEFGSPIPEAERLVQGGVAKKFAVYWLEFNTRHWTGGKLFAKLGHPANDNCKVGSIIGYWTSDALIKPYEVDPPVCFKPWAHQQL